MMMTPGLLRNCVKGCDSRPGSISTAHKRDSVAPLSLCCPRLSHHGFTKQGGLGKPSCYVTSYHHLNGGGCSASLLVCRRSPSFTASRSQLLPRGGCKNKNEDFKREKEKAGFHLCVVVPTSVVSRVGAQAERSVPPARHFWTPSPVLFDSANFSALFSRGKTLSLPVGQRPFQTGLDRFHKVASGGLLRQRHCAA
jgi:hypothetical protein